MKVNLNPDNEGNILSFGFNTDGELEKLILVYQSDYDVLSIATMPHEYGGNDGYRVFFIRKSE